MTAEQKRFLAGQFGLLGAATVVLGMIGCDADAQTVRVQQCGPFAKMQEHLAKHYGERLVGLGIAGPQLVMQLLVAESGTWTLLAVGPDGNACVVAVGKGWETIVPVTGQPT